MNENNIGKCGDNCSYCPRFIKNNNNRYSELKKVKELWVRLGLRDDEFTVEDMVCYGCFPENKCAYSDLRSCVHEKEIENCGFCAEYPCEVIEDVFDKTEKLTMNAKNICTQEEMEMFEKAFASKKENLDYSNNCK